MSEAAPILTFRASVPSTASPRGGLRRALGPPHASRMGRGALTRQELPPADHGCPVEAGDRGRPVSSNGANGNGTFHDRSTVVQAERVTRFGFDTEATLERRHGATWHARFGHRYALGRSGDGTVVSYTCEVRPQNFVPYWLKPGIRPVTRVIVQRLMRRNLANLVEMAESARPRPRIATP